MERRTPSGAISNTRSAGVSAGTTVTRHSIRVSILKIFCLIPKSYATTWKRGETAAPVFSRQRYGSEQVTCRTRSCPTSGGADLSFLRRSAGSKLSVDKIPCMAPRCRILRVSARVSIPSIATIRCRFRSASSVPSERQLLGNGLYSFTINPSSQRRFDSTSSEFTPQFPIRGYVIATIWPL